jgi:hypothetical protein
MYTFDIPAWYNSTRTVDDKCKFELEGYIEDGYVVNDNGSVYLPYDHEIVPAEIAKNYLKEYHPNSGTPWELEEKSELMKDYAEFLKKMSERYGRTIISINTMIGRISKN